MYGTQLQLHSWEGGFFRVVGASLERRLRWKRRELNSPVPERNDVKKPTYGPCLAGNVISAMPEEEPPHKEGRIVSITPWIEPNKFEAQLCYVESS